jgi:outer membrane lipoprotein carrier protein
VEEETVKQRSALSAQHSAKEALGLRGMPSLRKSGGFLILFLFIISIVSFVHAATDDDDVNELQKKFSLIRDVKGTFSQTSYLKDLEKTETYSGSFYIKKPSGVMWEYKTPRDEKVIMNGTDTWIYRQSLRQAIKTRFSKEAYSQVPIALLNSLENLRADFDITVTENETLNLKPRHQMGFIREIVIKTSPGNFPVKTLKVFDIYGNVITIELANIKTNSGLDDSLFTFTAPQGVEVFDMNH